MFLLKIYLHLCKDENPTDIVINNDLTDCDKKNNLGGNDNDFHNEERLKGKIINILHLLDFQRFVGLIL